MIKIDHMRSALIFSLVYLCTNTPLFAQKEHNVWHFGEHAGIDFNPASPKGIRTSLPQTAEGSASICDGTTGELLFSTNGNYIYNREGKPIKGFDGLRNEVGNSSTQSALIIPFAKDANKYFVFFSDQCGYMRPNEGVEYLILDMRGDNGLGEVVSGPVSLFFNNMSEKLTAIPHSNGCDVWVLTHRQTSNEYLATLIHDSTITTTPVVSALGHTPQPGGVPGFESGGIGWMVASQQGDRVAYVTTDGRIELLRFDRSTGVLSDLFGITVKHGSYGACFSPDGSRLYVSGIPNIGIRQYDLTQSNDKIEASAVNMGNISVGAIRPMPNGKLYCVTLLAPGLSVINDPNALGEACNYQFSTLMLPDSSYCALGLPNIPDAFIGRSMRPCLPPPEASVTDGSSDGDLEIAYLRNENVAEFESQTVGSAMIAIIDANGRRVQQTSEIIQAGSPFRLDVSHLPAGVYFLELNGALNSLRKSFVIVR
jgi:hypothetical protein